MSTSLEQVLQALRACPIVASAQADPGAPLDNPESIVRLAESSLKAGVRVLRVQSERNVNAVLAADPQAILIGLVKSHHDGFAPYITPGREEVRSLLRTGCQVVGMDGTKRPRPDGSTLKELVAEIHAAGRLALADCDNAESMRFARACGVDMLSTTLAGYTEESPRVPGPDLELLRETLTFADCPVLGEGRYLEAWQVQSALRMGAAGVVMGSALNDPVRMTQHFRRATAKSAGPVGSVDLGGTWLRFGVFDSDWKLLSQERVPTPGTSAERLSWIKDQIARAGVKRVGISSGGTIDPKSGEVWESKPLIPGHEGTVFQFEGCESIAMNDGLATAWGHACHPRYAGLRVATLALGTGVGLGVVERGRLQIGPRGEYPRLNDTPLGVTNLEGILGGAALGGNAPEAARAAVALVRALFVPDRVVVCGGVGLSGKLELDAEPSPFGEDAGLYGAAALALFPPSLG